MKFKLIIYLILVLLFAAFFLEAEENSEFDYKELAKNGTNIQVSGILNKGKSEIILQSEKNKYKLIFPLKVEELDLDKEVLDQDFIFIEGKERDNSIAVINLRYSDKIIEFTGNAEIAFKKYDIFIDFDGDGICDKRNNKLFFGKNLLQKFKSYQSVFGENKNFKSGTSHSKHGGNHGDNGNYHGGDNGGGS